MHVPLNVRFTIHISRQFTPRATFDVVTTTRYHHSKYRHT